MIKYIIVFCIIFFSLSAGLFIENPNEALSVQITDNLGKVIDKRTVVRKENQYNNLALNPGAYLIEVVFEDKVVRKKVVVN